MPKSKHRRKGRARPRAYETKPPEHKPAPSPPWLAPTAAGLLVGGVVVILVGQTLGGFMRGWPLLGQNWGLVAGFMLLITGFLLLIRWR